MTPLYLLIATQSRIDLVTKLLRQAYPDGRELVGIHVEKVDSP